MQVDDWVLPSGTLRRFVNDGDVERDCIERIGQVVAVGDDGITLEYLYTDGITLEYWGAVLTNTGELVGQVTIPAWMGVYLKPVTFVDLGYDTGDMGGQLVPRDVLMKRNWKNDHVYKRARGSIHKRASAIAKDIKENGLRHPPTVDETLKLMYGAARTWAHDILETEYVECYVIDRASLKSPVDHGCKGRLA